MVHAIYGVKSLTEVEVITSSRKYELKIFDFAGHTQGLVVVDKEGPFRFNPVFTFYLFTNFQVIFVSSDRSESEMLQYMQVNNTKYGIPINMDEVLETDPLFPFQEILKIIICFFHQNVVFVYSFSLTFFFGSETRGSLR